MEIKQLNLKALTLSLLCASSVNVGMFCLTGYAQTTAQTTTETRTKVETKSDAEAANDLGSQIFAKADKVFDEVSNNHYRHLHEKADEQVTFDADKKCSAITDCSGFVSYLLSAVAPKQYDQILQKANRSHPRARDYATFFTSLTPEKAENGWMRLTKVRDLRRGDIIAWAKRVDPDANKKAPSGHVLVVAEQPTVISEFTLQTSEAEVSMGNLKTVHDPDEVQVEKFRYVTIPVIDSSSVKHFPPEVLPPKAAQKERDGVGKGSIRLILNSSDIIVGYWEGTYSGEHNREIKRPTFSDLVGMARVTPY